MPKLVMMPPQDDETRQWAKDLAKQVPAYQVVVPETDEEARQEIVDAEAAFGRVPAEALAQAQKLEWIQSRQAGPSAGYYYPALIDHAAIVCNPRGVYNDHIAQHIMMYVLALARGLPYYVAAQRERRWDKEARKHGYIDLIGATALIAGVGGIGHETARLCNAFRMRVIGVDLRWEYAAPEVEKYGPEDLDTLLPEVDFVIVTYPHTPETEGLWNADRFRLMKQSAYFINIGRGATTKLDDLVAALEGGQIAGCALDVFEVEPLPADHQLWTLPNVLLTPHIAVKDAENIPERQFEVLLDNARHFAAGEPLQNVVDKKAWF